MRFTPCGLALSFAFVFRVSSALAADAKESNESSNPGPRTAAPQYGRWGFDRAGSDPATKPGDDFFRHANGAWLDRVQIPSDKPAYSLRLAMTDAVEQRLHQMLEAGGEKGDEPRALEEKVRAFYRSFMDEAQVEKLGAAPLRENLEAIREAKDRPALAALMGRQNADLAGAIFGIFIDVDLKEPSRYAVYLGQGGLGLPDRDYYLKPDFAAPKKRVSTLHRPTAEADRLARGREARGRHRGL